MTKTLYFQQSRWVIFLLFLMGGGISCTKFLAEKTQSDVTPVTTADYSELLFGTGYPKTRQNFMQELHYMDDDIECYSGLNPNNDGTGALPAVAMFGWQPDFFQLMLNGSYVTTYVDSYKNYYGNLVGCNIAIQFADGSEGSQADKDYLKGEAYALRAYYYLQLVNIYGRPYNDSTTTPAKSPGVPLILTSNLSQNMPARNSVGEVYQQIISDLDSAFARLDGERRTGDLFRLNHISAHLLASRVNLYMGQWDSVISQASYVLQYHPQLMDLNSWIASGWYPGENTLVNMVAGTCPESIWNFDGNFEYQMGNSPDQMMDVSEDLANQFDPADLRNQIYFTATPSFLLAYVAPLYISQKHDGFDALNSPSTSFRTSEAYLNRAEAYAQKYLLTNDPAAAQNALNDLNTLRAKRFAPADFVSLGAMTPDSLLTFCRNERRRELFDEDQRWFDLRRYGMPAITHIYSPIAGTTQTYQLNAHDPQYTLAIPPTAFLLNTNLVQNPTGPERAAN